MKRLLTNASLPVLLFLLLLGCEQKAADAQSAGEQTTASSTETTASDTLDLPETNYYAIDTPQGRMVVRLFDATPRHRDNFKTLVAEGVYDSTLFHRVIASFMIQGGDPNSKDANPANDGEGGPGYTIPAEILPDLIHRRGALAAARQGDAVNPERRSSGSQFYIVQGRPIAEAELDQMQQALRQRIPDPTFAYSDSARAVYTTEGGTPFLDRQYTVFGQLVEGYAVLDSIAATPTPRSTGRTGDPRLTDRPIEDVPMTITPLPDYVPPDSSAEQ